MDFYNSATDALLNQYSKEVRVLSGSETWKTLVVYKNVLRAIDNIGINALYVIKYYLRGRLNNAEMIQYLKTQVQSLEYLTQASNFSPIIRKKIIAIREGRNYKSLYEIWEDVEDETTTVDTKNETEVKIFSQKLFESTFAYLNDIRSIEANQLSLLKSLSQDANDDSRWNIYQSVALIFFVLGTFINHVDVITYFYNALFDHFLFYFWSIFKLFLGLNSVCIWYGFDLYLVHF